MEDILTTRVTALLTVYLGRAPTEAEIENGIVAPWSLSLVQNNLIPGQSTYSITTEGDVQEAIANLTLNNGGTLYLAPGIYNLTEDLLLPSDLTIIGSGPDTILDFGGTAFGVKMQGTFTDDTGTVSITDGSNTVTGVGTAFDVAWEGQTISIAGSPFDILTVDSATQITIDGPYYGPDLSGVSYVIYDALLNGNYRSFTIQNTTGIGFYAQYVAGQFNMDTVTVVDCGEGIVLDNVGFPTVNFGIFGMNTGDGFRVTNAQGVILEGSTASTCAGNALTFDTVSNSTIHDCEFSDAGGDGMSLVNCSNISIEAMTMSRSDGSGISTDGTTFSQINESYIEGNGVNGITIVGGNCLIVGQCNFLNNGSFGMSIDSGSVDTLVAANIFSTNGVDDAGTGTLIRSNIGVSDN